MAALKLSPYLENFPKISVDDLLELFRELRQSTTSKDQQEENACEIEPCILLLAKIVDYLMAGNADNVIDKFVLSVSARVGVQFLGNAIVENESNQKLLWNHSALLKKIFSYNDTKMKNYVSMVYYNIMLFLSTARDDMIADDEFIFMLLDEALLGLTEFPQFIVEKFIEFNYYDKLYAEQRRPLHRIYILDLILSMLKSDKGFVLDLNHVRKISEDFKRQADTILITRKPNEEENGQIDSEQSSSTPVQDPRLAAKLLSTLCSLTSEDKNNKIVGENTPLVIDTIYILRAMKMVEEAQKENGTKSESSSSPPIIGFKGDLVRLLANLCWKNKKNQDLVRENHCIELILECCKLDENNPFICEWAVMAILNLCEDNPDNQNYVTSLKRNTETELAASLEKVKMNENNQSSS